ncbi:MAG: dihydroxyacetone kinase subunit DhaK [Spirochaetales bacterium]|nr:dihydroxyacetone kinase subunit DhaK [Spirochaetales bacterium]
MKKFINDSQTIVGDMIDGFVRAYGERVRKLPGSSVIVRTRPKTVGRVGLAIGNGSGHEPACIGFVGENMLDANAYGNIFAAPGPDTIRAAIAASDRGAGVVLLVSNHEGDVINARMAIEMARDDGITVEEVILYDDIASASAERIEERRGTTGTLFVYKMAGVYAEISSDVSRVADLARRIRDRTRTLTVASTPGVSPLTGSEMFRIADDELQLGMGVHGEAARGTISHTSARDVARLMVERLVVDGGYEEGDELGVIVNGCGSTTQMELLIFFGAVAAALGAFGITTYKPLIGSFVTTQEMGGIALSLCKFDDRCKSLWRASTGAIAFSQYDETTS